MLSLADKLLALLIVVGLPLRAWYGMRKLNAAPPEEVPGLRPRLWRRAVATDESIRRRIRERLAPVARLMPTQTSDFRLFAALACTAGLCEEFLFRGYLAWVAALLLPFPVAPAAQALVFGICHAYQ